MKVGAIEFDTVEYDRGGDVLYLHVGDPSSAVKFDETPEGHHVRFDASGQVVGLTVVRPKHLLATEGEIKLTIPTAERLEAAELEAVLA